MELPTVKCLGSAAGASYCLYHGDCIEIMRQLPADSVDLSVFSPPFSHLYIYSGSVRDMGNVRDDAEFQATYYHCAKELFRVTRPGRIACVHVKDLVQYSNASEDGSRGLRDFSGDTIATMKAAGWTYHSRTTVHRCPVDEMQKTKNDRLLFKNFRTDAARSGIGLPEYILVFRKWAPGMDDTPPVTHDPAVFPLEIWQEWASPVWLDTNPMDVLNVRAARDPEAERHLCPMPLDLIRRCVYLWSNPGEVVLSPFAGIGSEGHEALKAGRRFIGAELSDVYFAQAARNLGLAALDAEAPVLFSAKGDAA